MVRLRRSLDEDGFTLIELMVVVLIIAVLIAIAIPAFLGARKRAQRRQAQSNLRNVVTVEHAYYTDGQKYTDDTSVLTSEEPNISYTNGASRDPGQVSVNLGGSDDDVNLAAWSKSRDCYFIYDNTPSGTRYDKNESGSVSQTTGCTAPTSAPATASGW